MPDVFSIRNTTVEGYLEPIVHEIKVSRADLLGNLKKKDKRNAYLDLGGQCWCQQYNPASSAVLALLQIATKVSKLIQLDNDKVENDKHVC